MNITKKIVAIRNLKKISQQEMGEMLGLTAQGYSRIERKNKKLKISRVEFSKKKTNRKKK